MNSYDEITDSYYFYCYNDYKSLAGLKYKTDKKINPDIITIFKEDEFIVQYNNGKMVNYEGDAVELDGESVDFLIGS